MTPRIASFSERMKVGQNIIVFTVSDTLFSKLIRWVTNSKVSHCAFYVGSHWVADSTVVNGVKIRSDGEFYKLQKPTRAFAVLDPHVAIANSIYESNKKSYGYFDVIWTFLTYVVCKKLRNFKNPIQDGYICSEFVAKYLDAATGSTLYSSSNPPTPEDILKWCENNLEEVTIDYDI